MNLENRIRKRVDSGPRGLGRQGDRKNTLRALEGEGKVLDLELGTSLHGFTYLQIIVSHYLQYTLETNIFLFVQPSLGQG